MRKMIYIGYSEAVDSDSNEPKKGSEVNILSSEKRQTGLYYVVQGYRYCINGCEQIFNACGFVDPLNTKAIADEFTEVIESPEKVEEYA